MKKTLGFYWKHCSKQINAENQIRKTFCTCWAFSNIISSCACLRKIRLKVGTRWLQVARTYFALTIQLCYTNYIPARKCTYDIDLCQPTKHILSYHKDTPPQQQTTCNSNNIKSHDKANEVRTSNASRGCYDRCWPARYSFHLPYTHRAIWYTRLSKK